MAVNFGVNYLAVVVAAVVALVIGFIWYSPPVFGNRWMAYLVAGVHGDDHGGTDLVREETLGTLGPEQRPQLARADPHGGDRHGLALTEGR